MPILQLMLRENWKITGFFSPSDSSWQDNNSFMAFTVIGMPRVTLWSSSPCDQGSVSKCCVCVYILIDNNTHTQTYLNEPFCLHILPGQSLLKTFLFEARLLKTRTYLQEGSFRVPGMLKIGISFAGHLPFKLGLQISPAIWILLPPFPSAISLRVLTWLSYRCCWQLHAARGTEIS